MSKRAQEKRTEEEPAVAKPRSACLVSRSLQSAGQASSPDSGNSYSRGESRIEPEFCLRGMEKPVRDRAQNSATNSQEWERDDNPFRSTVKPVRSGVCER